MYSYNERQRDALFLNFFLISTLHVSDSSTVHHQEYLNTVHTQQMSVMIVLLAVCERDQNDHASRQPTEQA